MTVLYSTVRRLLLRLPVRSEKCEARASHTRGTSEVTLQRVGHPVRMFRCETPISKPLRSHRHPLPPDTPTTTRGVTLQRMHTTHPPPPGPPRPQPRDFWKPRPSRQAHSEAEDLGTIYGAEQQSINASGFFHAAITSRNGLPHCGGGVP